MINRSNLVSSVKSLGAVSEIRAGYSFRARLEHDPKGATAVIQMKDLAGDTLLHTSSASRCTLPDLDRHLIKGGDILFRSRGRTNTCALVADDLAPAALAAPLVLIRPRGILPHYLRWYLNSEECQAVLSKFAAGTSVQMIPLEHLRAFPVPVPPRDVQERIADTALLAQREREIHERLAALRHRTISRKLFELASKKTTK